MKHLINLLANILIFVVGVASSAFLITVAFLPGNEFILFCIVCVFGGIVFSMLD